MSINITATEVDPNKKYVFVLDRQLTPGEYTALKEALTKSGFQGLVWRGPMKIIDFDQIKGYIEIKDE